MQKSNKIARHVLGRNGDIYMRASKESLAAFA